MQQEYIAVANLPDLKELETHKFIVFSASLLKELRKKAGYKSQEAFSQASGIPLQTIKTWELGTKPDMVNLGRLGAFFGVYFYAPWPEEKKDKSE